MARHYERLLPLGSVVLLHGANKRLMIIGRIQARTGDMHVYDYSACYYPEGLLGPAELMFFDHDAIDQLFFVGYQDDEELSFRENRLAQLGDLDVDKNGRIYQR